MAGPRDRRVAQSRRGGGRHPGSQALGEGEERNKGGRTGYVRQWRSSSRTRHLGPLRETPDAPRDRACEWNTRQRHPSISSQMPAQGVVHPSPRRPLSSGRPVCAPEPAARVGAHVQRERPRGHPGSIQHDAPTRTARGGLPAPLRPSTDATTVPGGCHCPSGRTGWSLASPAPREPRPQSRPRAGGGCSTAGLVPPCTDRLRVSVFGSGLCSWRFRATRAAPGRLWPLPVPAAAVADFGW